MTKILLIDRSGRGHAFADLFVRTSPNVTVLYAPGCGAIHEERIISLPDLPLNDAAAMAEVARREEVEFIFVANALALAGGFAGVLREQGIPTIGPSREAARLEASKTFGKQVCARHGVPVAEHAFFNDPERAKEYVRTVPYQVVVKADGLCGGNGSIVCTTVADAEAAIDRIMIERAFDEAGDSIVIERRLFGREVSIFAMFDGRSFTLLPMAMDYPKSDDGNMGVTCGGMGAFSPHPIESDAFAGKAREEILEPLGRAITAEGLEYNGIIYAGCMLVDDRLVLLEINVRLGDPEAETVLPRIESDFVETCRAVLGRSLDGHRLRVSDRFCCDVVAAQGRTQQRSGGRSKGWYAGWPYGRYGRHYPITGIEQADPSACRVFIGEAFDHPDKGLVSDGGRVIHVVGFGSTLAEASDNAYDNIRHIHFEGMRYRTDIGRMMPWEEPAASLASIDTLPD